MRPTLHSLTVHAAAACLLPFGGRVCATMIVDGSFENQAGPHGISHSFQQTQD
jgi:hypothetical protein